MNGNLLINKAGKWRSNSGWQLPPEGSAGYIINLNTNMSLNIVNRKEIIEEYLDNTPRQNWNIGKADREGYFTITNPASGKVLTANSKDRLTIEGITTKLYI